MPLVLVTFVSSAVRSSGAGGGIGRVEGDQFAVEVNGRGPDDAKRVDELLDPVPASSPRPRRRDLGLLHWAEIEFALPRCNRSRAARSNSGQLRIGVCRTDMIKFQDLAVRLRYDLNSHRPGRGPDLPRES